MNRIRYYFLKALICHLMLYGCNSEKKEPQLFTIVEHQQTGLDFSNQLVSTPDINAIEYMYFYNGAGVGAGDFNNDGKIDLFFASNQNNNKIYLNKGDLKFEDVTVHANIPQDGGWSTGISVVDINNDGLLDIYICRVGQFLDLKAKNQLLICLGLDQNGVPSYEDKAAEYGLDFSGFSTQAAFFDYDLDGDLDMYLLNHAVHQDGNFAERNKFLNTYHPRAGDRLYRNDSKNSRNDSFQSEDNSAVFSKKPFTDVTIPSGIHSSAIGYGLGISIADINSDGYPDLYIGNDFHENDYLYINQHDGTFKDELAEKIMHTSKFSMGVDVADINNDIFPEIITVDMLPSDPYHLKRSLGDDEYNIFKMKVRYGYHEQYAYNTLQLNRGNGHFSEIARYAGVHATDWSWAPLWFDFDNDGLKDLFVSNGIPRRLNDMDYVNYITNENIQDRLGKNQLGKNEMEIIDQFPQIKLKNKFYINQGNASFKDAEINIGNDKSTFSNGAAYADLDNDGDLDVVVNNINEPVLIYKNLASQNKKSESLTIYLKGPPENIQAIGSKLLVYTPDDVRSYENNPVKGFQSSMLLPFHIGLQNATIDSIILIWPDKTWQKINRNGNQKHLEINYEQGLPIFDFQEMTARKKPVLKAKDITVESALFYRHEENPFVEFDREPLIPFMVSSEGPALAVADINNDGWEDVFIGASKTKKPAVFVQDGKGKFIKTTQPALDADSTYEDVDAAWIDVNGDGWMDLVIASGGNEYYGNNEFQKPRVYLNTGNGELIKKEDAFDSVFLTASSLAANDVNGDGFVDLFIGARAVPWHYGQKPVSSLLINDGTGKFTNIDNEWSRLMTSIGFVKHAIWFDLDKNGDKDLLIATEWDGIYGFFRNDNIFQKKLLTDKKGWWNFLLPVDVNGNGYPDLIAGNEGLNNRLKPSSEQPIRLYYNDFDGNGNKEQILTYYLAGKEIPIANKTELEKQLPFIKKKFLLAGDFANASLKDVFPSPQIKSAEILMADYFANAYLVNDNHGKFSVKDLPWQAQLTSYKTAIVIHVNNDSLPDIFLAGNFYDTNIQMGRNDADYGLILVNQGNGKFFPTMIKDVVIKGQVKRMQKINMPQGEAVIIARNNDSLMLLQFIQ